MSQTLSDRSTALIHWKNGAGKTLTLHYRIIVMQSEMSPRQLLEILYQAYIKGMKVK